jgi:hypothetical protein
MIVILIFFFIIIIIIIIIIIRCRDNAVGIATGYGLGDQGSIPVRGKRFISSPQCPGRPWGPPSLLSNGYWDLFPGG